MRDCLAITFAFVAIGLTAAADPCRSGLQANQRPGPYSSLVSVGPQRGTQHCFICETGDRPMVIVFARGFSDPLGKLVNKLDKALIEHKTAELRAWVTFLADDHTAADPKVVEWGKKHATGNVPLCVFEDVVGPPTYLLAREADVTILLAVKQKVIANFAFRAGELSDQAIGEVARSVSKIITKK